MASPNRPVDDRVTVLGPGNEPPAPRRRLPLIMALGLLVVVAAVAGTFASSTGTTTTTSGSVPDLAGGATAEDLVTTTTTTLPATLAERLPGFEGIVTLAVRTESGGGATLLWGSSERAARIHELVARPDTASFDASGAWISYLAYTDANPTLFVGLRTGSQRAEATAVTGAAWHPTVARALAWVTTIPTDRRTVLLIGQVDPQTGVLGVGREVAEVTAGSSIEAWGDWGFAIGSATEEGPVLTVLTPDGAVAATAPGTVRGATADGRFLVESAADPAAPVAGVTVYLTDASLVPGGPQWTVAPDAGVALHPAGIRVAEAGPRESFTAVTSHAVDPVRAPRITSVGTRARLIGYSDDGNYLVLQELDDRGAVLLLDWNTGAGARLEIDGATVLAAEMQPTLQPGAVSPSG